MEAMMERKVKWEQQGGELENLTEGRNAFSLSDLFTHGIFYFSTKEGKLKESRHVISESFTRVIVLVHYLLTVFICPENSDYISIIDYH